MDLIFPSFIPLSSFLNGFISQHSKILFISLAVSYYTAKKNLQAPYLQQFQEKVPMRRMTYPQISELLIPKVHSLTFLFYLFLLKVRFIDEYFTYIKFIFFIPFYSSRSFDFCAGSLMTIKSSPNAFDSHKSLQNLKQCYPHNSLSGHNHLTKYAMYIHASWTFFMFPL